MHLLAPAYIPSVSHSAILYLPHPRNPELLSVSQREKQSNHQNPVLTLGLEASYFLSSYLLDPQIALVLRCSVMSLCNTMDYSLPCSRIHGIHQKRILEWGARPSSRGSSQPRWNPRLLCLLHREEDSLPLAPPGKSQDLQLPAPKWGLSWPSFLKDTSSPLFALFYWLKTLNSIWNFF